MNKATVLEPIQLDSKEEAIFKEKWCKIQKYLKELGMGLDVTTTFEVEPYILLREAPTSKFA